MITANSDQISVRNRHFLMRHETVRDLVKSSLIKLKYLFTDLCKANGLTNRYSGLNTQDSAIKFK